MSTPDQETAARSRVEQEQAKCKRAIASELKTATPFWPAEKYHDFHLQKTKRVSQLFASIEYDDGILLWLEMRSLTDKQHLYSAIQVSFQFKNGAKYRLGSLR